MTGHESGGEGLQPGKKPRPDPFPGQFTRLTRPASAIVLGCQQLPIAAREAYAVDFRARLAGVYAQAANEAPHLERQFEQSKLDLTTKLEALLRPRA